MYPIAVSQCISPCLSLFAQLDHVLMVVVGRTVLYSPSELAQAISSLLSRLLSLPATLGQDILLHRVYEVGDRATAVSSHYSSLACCLSSNHVGLFRVSILFVAVTESTGEALLPCFFSTRLPLLPCHRTAFLFPYGGHARCQGTP